MERHLGLLVSGLLVACLAASGCRVNSAYMSIPRAEREPFERCRASVRPVVCAGVYDSRDLLCATREGDAADDFARVPRSQRTAWLVGHGCPEAVAAYGVASTPTLAARSSGRDTPSGLQALAVQTASTEHGCPASRVMVQTVDSATQGMWLAVCGEQRWYRWHRSERRFVDETPTSR